MYSPTIKEKYWTVGRFHNLKNSYDLKFIEVMVIVSIKQNTIC